MATQVESAVRASLAEARQRSTVLQSAIKKCPEYWWKLLAIKVGIIPLPVYLLLAATLTGLTVAHKITTDISLMMAVSAIGGFGLGAIGKNIPILRSMGGGVICATFIPSALAYYHWVPDAFVQPLKESFKSTNILYVFIAAIIVGSILSMDRDVLIKGFFKIFIPLATGSVVAASVGTLTGMAFGRSAYETFFFTVVPIMGGGVGEGAIPLSIGYGQILHQDQGQMFARVLPPVMVGSLCAILFAGLLNHVGKRYPHLTGEGRLQPGVESDLGSSNAKPENAPIDVSNVASAGTMIISLYLLGVLFHAWVGLPAPVGMLFAAVGLKLVRAISPALHDGAFVVYKFFHVAVVYPILFVVGAAITPWDELMAAFRLSNLVIIAATVFSMILTGFVMGRLLNMYPIETAIVNATHSGQGGTGDVAILTAANRMVLMPFAQVATRIGGAITVTLALILISRFS